MRTLSLELSGDFSRRSEVTLTIEGDFDLEAAMRAACARCDASRVVLDLRAARRIHDVALAVLIREMAGCRVEILGLSRHHERLLRYLAEDAARGERRIEP